MTPEDLDEADLRAIDLMAAGDADGATAILMQWTEKFFGPMQQMSPEEFHVQLQKTRPPGENWFEDKPHLVPLFEADFQRAHRDVRRVRPRQPLVAGRVGLRPGRRSRRPSGSSTARATGWSRRLHGQWLHERLPDSEVRVVPGGHGHATFGAAVGDFAELAVELRLRTHLRGFALPGRVHQAYADPADALEIARLGRRLAELAAQPRQVHVDGPVGAAVGLLPHLDQQGALADDLAGALGERQQQVELPPGQLELLAGQGGGAGRLVDQQLADPDRLGRRAAVGAAASPPGCGR